MSARCMKANRTPLHLENDDLSLLEPGNRQGRNSRVNSNLPVTYHDPSSKLFFFISTSTQAPNPLAAATPVHRGYRRLLLTRQRYNGDPFLNFPVFR